MHINKPGHPSIKTLRRLSPRHVHSSTVRGERHYLLETSLVWATTRVPFVSVCLRDSGGSGECLCGFLWLYSQYMQRTVAPLWKTLAVLMRANQKKKKKKKRGSQIQKKIPVRNKAITGLHLWECVLFVCYKNKKVKDSEIMTFLQCVCFCTLSFLSFSSHIWCSTCPW